MHPDLAVDRIVPISLGYDDMARQHRAVRIEASELRGMIDSRRATQRTDGYRQMLSVLLGRLRERLALHFEIEQEGAQGAHLRATHPEHAAALDRFAAEHAGLLAEAGRLALLLRSPSAPPGVVGKTMQWLDALRQHEQAEDQLLAVVAAAQRTA